MSELDIVMNQLGKAMVAAVVFVLVLYFWNAR
jgi:hypothetical protein